MVDVEISRHILGSLLRNVFPQPTLQADRFCRVGWRITFYNHHRAEPIGRCHILDIRTNPPSIQMPSGKSSKRVVDYHFT